MTDADDFYAGSSLSEVVSKLPGPTVEPTQGDARALPYPDSSVDLIVTSPPYFAKRTYGHDDEIGHESTPLEFVASIMKCLDDWQRVLRPTGSIFLNIGDSYYGNSLAGIPGRIEAAAVDNGWLVRNRIIWAKDDGMPEAVKNRLASRHEYVLHLTRSMDYYYDLFGYSSAYWASVAAAEDRLALEATDVKNSRRRKTDQKLAADRVRMDELVQDSLFNQTGEVKAIEEDSIEAVKTANPGDVWWLLMDRNMGRHLAPYPRELVSRAILMACPEVICTECQRPWTREVARTSKLDPSRPQAKRAMALAAQHKLTPRHIAAIQATGVSDAGKALKTQTGTGRNAQEVQKLAAEAKAALGGYFREFTFALQTTAGWRHCGHDAQKMTRGTVLDPFVGTGTTLRVARELGRHALGVDLVTDHVLLEE
ncbi:site-specific DNA-methyltransferase [Catenulispora sp. NF23]|uniref:DNA-methyltransferase n=1 Tax=Catenulispora pinistramenti TaxID=2705254 RepID=UPI001BABE051|nr:site-specific DNA-methyltransferase [Catenulispora pinistramenti]MBS2533841.1 site-specific DNA-methyltransferase [Catenulispora pinistramenti]